MRTLAIALLLLGLAAPVAAQTNLCAVTGGETSVTVPAGTSLRVGFCHSLRDVAGQLIGAIPTFVGVTSAGDSPLAVVEVGLPLADGRRWFETIAAPVTAGVTFTVVAISGNGRSIPSAPLTIALTSTALPSGVTGSRLIR